MGDTIRQTYEGILKLLETVIIPDWGALIGLIPVGLLLVTLALLARLAARWFGFFLAQPDLTPSYRTAASLRTTILRRLALVPAGSVLIGLALTILPKRVGPLPQVGLDLVVLLVGIIVALLGVGLAVAATESADVADERGPRAVRSLRQVVRGFIALADGLPLAARPLAGVTLGLVIIIGAFIVAGGRPAPGKLPEVNIVLVLVGVLIGLGGLASGMRAWETTEQAAESPSPGAEASGARGVARIGPAGPPAGPTGSGSHFA